MNKVYIILKEEDWFYDDKYSSVTVFNSLESAKIYLQEYLEVMLAELEDDYGEGFQDDIEINDYRTDGDPEDVVSVYMEDSYYIRLSIEEHDVMSME